MQAVTEDSAGALGLDGTNGALVSSVMPGSPAEEAGIEVGDVIVEFGGDTIEDPRELQRVVADADIGSSVEATVRRGDGTETLTVRLGRMETGRQVADRPVEPNEDKIGRAACRERGCQSV